MSGLALLLETPGMRLASAGPDVVVAEHPAGGTHRVGVLALEAVIIDAAPVWLDSQALSALCTQGVPVLALPQGRDPWRCWVQHGNHGMALRRAQYAALDEPTLRLSQCRALLQAKWKAQASALHTCGAPMPAALAQAPERALQCADVASLRGVEGATARAHWAAWGSLWGGEWGWTGRRRRPAPDPLNALLSLGYTLALGPCAKACWRQGLEPALGWLHEPLPGRPALALDVLEAARGGVELWVWQVVRQFGLTPADFELAGEAASTTCRMAAPRRRELYAHWFMHGQPHAQRAATAMTHTLAGLLRAGATDEPVDDNESLAM